MTLRTILFLLEPALVLAGVQGQPQTRTQDQQAQVQQQWQLLERAARLAARHQAQLHCLLLGQPEATAVNWDEATQELAHRHGIVVQLLAPQLAGQTVGGPVQAVLHRSAQADLLVLTPQLAQRFFHPVLQARTCPVLVMRPKAQEPARQQAASPLYQQVLLNLDAPGRSQALVRFAGGLETAAGVELFHAPGHQGEHIWQALQGYKKLLRQQARDGGSPATRLGRGAVRRVRWSDAFAARRNRVDMATGEQNRARQLVVQQQRSRADLLALVYRPRTGLWGLLRRWLPQRWGQWLPAGLAQRVRDRVRCDLLVFPQGYGQQSSQDRGGAGSVAGGTALDAGHVAVAVRGAA